MAKKEIKLDENGKEIKIKRTDFVPTKDIDFGKVAEIASNKWEAETWLKLLWVTSDEFKQKQVLYNKILAIRLEQGGNKPKGVKEIAVLDKKINDTVSYVKGYIIDKYKKDSAPSYYKSFGFVFENKSNRFPKDQDTRLQSLNLMVKAIEENGFSDKEFGLAFWKNIRDKYQALLKQTSNNDGAISVNVKDKNVLKKSLAKIMNALVLNIKSNYPDTFKGVLRDWGFQKEKY